MIASAPRSIQTAFLENLTDAELGVLPDAFAFWAMSHQLPPDGNWRSWVILGGRGAGKTRAGAEWIRSLAESGTAQRIALIGETMAQTRDVMVLGESGLMAVSSESCRPTWIASRNLLIWPNGVQAQIYSSFDPESLRGPQFDAAWIDEFAKWPKPQDTWDMLQFALRLGDTPRVLVTTTPRNVPALRKLLEADSTVVTHANTFANAANLSPAFLEFLRAEYDGTAMGRQEIEGVLIETHEGALWQLDQIESVAADDVPELDRIVVAVDPPATGHAHSDLCGIVVAGVVAKGPPQTWEAYVLADASFGPAAPIAWAQAVSETFHRFQADLVVAEVNQGGDMVRSVLETTDAGLPIKAVHATRGKSARAEPVSALYAQGRVRHVRGLSALEDEMALMTNAGFQGKGSPDRVDALVWALNELLMAGGRGAAPQMRTLF